ncbi:MAG: alpha/beta fold hydrolase [Mycobacteriales bacterium]
MDEGSGPTLLFLHGNPTWSFVCRDVIRTLRAEFRCIALDYPGFGLSTARPGYRFLPEEHAQIPAGHRLREPTAAEMAHYRQALPTPKRREASAVLLRRITVSCAFLADVETGLADVASLPTLIVWGDADFAFRAKERQRWEQLFADHHTVIGEGAGHFVQSDAPDQFAAAIREWRSRPGQRKTRRRGSARHETSPKS